jgi:serine protease inhibitor
MIAIDEEGTKATSVTIAMALDLEESDGESRLFVADRPFFFAIWNKKAELPLFFGQFCQPHQ